MDTDRRTIAEIYGLDDHDPWDNRSDKEREADAAIEKSLKDAEARELADEDLAAESDEPTGEIDSKIATREKLEQRAVERREARDALQRLPRPWNDNGSAEPKEYTGDEFIMCGSYDERYGTTVVVQPRAYFDKHGQLWEHSLDIGHLLPSNLEEIEPCVYRARHTHWHRVNQQLIACGLRESLILQAFLNSL